MRKRRENPASTDGVTLHRIARCMRHHIPGYAQGVSKWKSYDALNGKIYTYPVDWSQAATSTSETGGQLNEKVMGRGDRWQGGGLPAPVADTVRTERGKVGDSTAVENASNEYTCEYVQRYFLSVKTIRRLSTTGTSSTSRPWTRRPPMTVSVVGWSQTHHRPPSR